MDKQQKPISFICLQHKKTLLWKEGQISGPGFPRDFPEAITQADAQLT